MKNKRSLCSRTIGVVIRGTAFAVLILLSACEQTTPEKTGMELPQAESVSVRTLWQSQQCKKIESSVEVFDTKNALQNWWKATHNTIMPTPPLPENLNQLDFQKEKVIIVFMGEKPSAGYSLLLADIKASLAKDVLHVSIIQVAPKNTSMQAQLITSPCLLLASSANFNEVRIHKKTQ